MTTTTVTTYETMTDEARELYITVENDYDMYRQQELPIIKNLMRKLCKGVYDTAKARKLAKYLFDNGSKQYITPPPYSYHNGHSFTPDQRRECADVWVANFEDTVSTSGYGLDGLSDELACKNLEDQHLDGHWQEIKTVKRGEFIKRSPSIKVIGGVTKHVNTVYVRGAWVSNKDGQWSDGKGRYSCQSHNDWNREIFMKKTALVWVGFTY